MQRNKPIIIGSKSKYIWSTSQHNLWKKLKVFLHSKRNYFKYIAFAVLFLAAVLCFRWVFPQIIAPQIRAFFKIENVRVKAQLEFASNDAVIEVIKKHTNLIPLYKVDSIALDKALNYIPWIDGVEVHKLWPSKIDIDLKETVPIAIWNKNSIVSHKGDVFKPANIDQHKGLPRLAGDEDQVQLVMEMYRQTSNIFRRANLTLVGVTYQDGLVWDLIVQPSSEDSPMTLIIDSEETLQRLHRFVTNYPSILKMEQTPKRVDLRYPTGMAVSWYEKS